MRMRSSLMVMAMLALTTVGCGAEPDLTTVLRTDSAGVEVVVSRVEDRVLDWRLERAFSLGGRDEGPESFYTVSARSVATDSAGKIYVLDTGGFRVLVFTPDGDFIREFGSEGEGPGELRFPSGLSVSLGGEVSVFDFGKGGLVNYGVEGTVLQHSIFPLYPLPNSQRHIAAFSDGMLVAAPASASSDGEHRHALHFVLGADTSIVADWSFPATQMAIYESCGGGLSLPRLFEVEIAWSTAAHSIVVSHRPEYELEMYRGTDLVRRFGRDLVPREATKALAEEELGEGFRINFGQGPCTIPPHEMVEGRGYAPFVPLIQDVALSPRGETWVRRKAVGPEPDRPIDVFDGTGEYIGTFASESPFPLVFLGDDRFGAAETDDFDITRLVIYRVLRN